MFHNLHPPHFPRNKDTVLGYTLAEIALWCQHGPNLPEIYLKKWKMASGSTPYPCIIDPDEYNLLQTKFHLLSMIILN